MKKIFTTLLILVSLFFSEKSSAQNWTVGTPVYMVVTSNLFFGTGCFPTADQSFIINGSTVTGVDYYLKVDSSPLDSVYLMPGMDTLVTGDSILLGVGGNNFSLYFFNGGGLLNMSIIAVGTPTTAGKSHPCAPNNLWMSNLLFCPEGLSAIVNNNCQVQAGSFSVTASSSATTCSDFCDGMATANVTGATQPVTYQWDNGATTQTITNLCGGTYTVVVTDGVGNSGAASVDVTSPAAIVVTTNLTNATCGTCADGSASASATGGTGPIIIWWSTGDTTNAIDSLLPGEYIVYATDSFGCGVVDTVTVSFEGAVKNISEFKQINIYPNPAIDKLLVSGFNSKPNSFEIQDMIGRTVISEKLEKGKSEYSIDVSSLPSAIYFITFKNIDGTESIKQFMKE